MKRILAAVLLWTLLFAGTTEDDVAALLEQDKGGEAFALAQDRAAAGDPEGDYALGWFYEDGAHVTADKPKALVHYRKCADAGLSQCQWRLGVMLDTGDGVTADSGTAFAWIAKAAAQDDLSARVSLAVMYATGRGTPVDYEKAMDLYQSAAKAGQRHGFYGIGILYALGQGVKADPQTAAAWIAVADSLGDTSAKPALTQLLDGKDDDYLRLVTVKAEEIYKAYVAPLAKPAPPAAAAAKAH